MEIKYRVIDQNLFDVSGKRSMQKEGMNQTIYV
jgi:hypothetical protein